MYNKKGDRFWKIQSREYPISSYNSKIILLLNGDQSVIRIIDNHGNEIGQKNIYGRLCTSIVFSRKNDFGAIGFINGRYYFINEKGKLIHKGITTSKKIVKTMAVSSNGAYGAVHYGDTQKDTVAIININQKDVNEIDLKNIHKVKTSIHISDNGTVTIHDIDQILNVDEDGDINFRMKVGPKTDRFLPN